MHESIRSVRWSWVGFGWFLAVALTSLLLLAFEAFGLIGQDEAADALWIGLAILISFATIGIFVGTRVVAAPIIHGLAIGTCSLLAWIVINIVLGEPLDATTWGDLDVRTTSGLIVLQMVAAIVGVRLGVRWMRTRSTVR